MGERKKLRGPRARAPPTQRECNWNGYKSRSRTIVFPRLYLQCILVSAAAAAVAAAAAAAYVSLIKPLGPSLRVSPRRLALARSRGRCEPRRAREGPVVRSPERESALIGERTSAATVFCPLGKRPREKEQRETVGLGGESSYTVATVYQHLPTSSYGLVRLVFGMRTHRQCGLAILSVVNRAQRTARFTRRIYIKKISFTSGH